MVKKHFKALAEAIATLSLSGGERSTVAQAIADVCARFNPRFDRARFLKACGVDSDKRER